MGNNLTLPIVIVAGIAAVIIYVMKKPADAEVLPDETYEEWLLRTGRDGNGDPLPDDDDILIAFNYWNDINNPPPEANGWVDWDGYYHGGFSPIINHFFEWV